MKTAVSHPDYPAFLAALKERILHARTSAARAVNRELVPLYWDIGRGIVEKQRVLGWGESVIDRLSADLQDAFPRTTGFSPRNLRDMKRFYLAYSDASIWRQPVAKMSKSLSPGRKPIWPQAVARLDESITTTDILCAEKDDVEVEFALKTKTNPIGVAEYQLQAKLPAEFKGRLPTAKQLADAVREALPPRR